MSAESRDPDASDAPDTLGEPSEPEPQPETRVVKEAYIRLTDVIFEWSKVLDPHQVRKLIS
jgi:hypothetical protein